MSHLPNRERTALLARCIAMAQECIAVLQPDRPMRLRARANDVTTEYDATALTFGSDNESRYAIRESL